MLYCCAALCIKLHRLLYCSIFLKHCILIACNLGLGCKEEMEELEESFLFGSYTPFAENVPVARSDGVATADGVACDVTTSCGGVSNGGGVTIRVAMGGGDTSTAKGRTKKSPKNNKVRYIL